MGLRERNAARTRDLILDTAMPLFLEQGYEHTTMEEIAERAQIGTSTLYRYFPSKDMLVIGLLALNGQMATELLARPADEPLDLALGHALRAILTTPRADSARLQQIGSVIDGAVSLRSRLLEEFTRERTLLERAVSERTGRPVDDVFCIVTARLTIVVLETIAEPGKGDWVVDTGRAVQNSLDRARAFMEQLRVDPPVVPRME